MKAFFETHKTNRYPMCRICNKQIELNEEHVILGGLNLPKNINRIHFHNKCLAESYGKFLESLKE